MKLCAVPTDRCETLHWACISARILGTEAILFAWFDKMQGDKNEL